MDITVIAPQVPPNTKGMPPRIPRASHRHAAPSGPWPWAETDEEDPMGYQLSTESLALLKSPDPWTGYPTSLFANWTSSRLQRSGITKFFKERDGTSGLACRIYYVDVDVQGRFSKPSHHDVHSEDHRKFWRTIQAKRPNGTRLRAIFIENLSAPVMQMLGTKYHIEPFFFTSSLNWIPSRYQEEHTEDSSDHITIVLNFLRAMDDPTVLQSPVTPGCKGPISRVGTVTIDPQAPLSLRSNDRVVLIDLLAVHMIRHKDSSTIISYHAPPEWQSTSARTLHSRFRFAGQSVYWRSIFNRYEDATLVLLSMLWHALYAWDNALETLYAHISWLEMRILVTNDIELTRELHIIRASLLHYTSLLEDFKKTVNFVQQTPNPAMQEHINQEECTRIMNRECGILSLEIERLEMFRKMQDMRLENLVNLAFNTVSFTDSQDMRSLTESTLRDSVAMKQISYLTMIFLPASFAASIFGMNIHEISEDGTGHLSHYVALALPLTAISIWILVALHTKNHQEQVGFSRRLRWPVSAGIKFAKSLWKRHKSKGLDMV